MKNTIFILAFSIVILSGCSKKDKPEVEKVNGEQLTDIVARSLSGNIAANNSLNKLIDFTFPKNTRYNVLRIDSVKNSSQKTFYTVLLQYPNPAYNRFAVYDSLLNNYLIDKSLNGNISEESISAGNLNFIKLNEQFISKDIFDLNRLSLYSISDTSVSLVFRTFVSFKYDEFESSQKVEEITNSQIKTTISSNRYSPVANKSDLFIFSQKSGKYESADTLFYKFILDKINSSKVHIIKPQITNERSLRKSVQ